MIRYSTKSILCFVVFIFTLGISYGQQAAPKNLESLSLGDLLNIRISTVSKVPQKLSEAPATAIVITANQIRIRGYRNLAQVISDLADFKVDDKSDPQMYNSVSVRGIFRQDHLIIMLDGIRISSPTNESLPVLENFPIYLAKQIEIVYGPGSALYGADAMAGVINIITWKSNKKNEVIAASLTGTQGYTSNSLYLSTGLKDNFRFTAAAQYTYDAQPDFSKIYKDAYDVSAYQTGKFNTVYGPVTTAQPIDARYQAPLKTYNLYTSLEAPKFYCKLLSYYVQVPSSTTLKPENAVHNKNVFYGEGVTVVSAGYTDSIGRIKSATALTGSFFNVNPQSSYRNVYGNMNRGYKFSNGSMIKAEQQLSWAPIRRLYLIGGVTGELFHSMPKSPELQYPVKKNVAINGILLNSTSIHNPGGIHADFYQITYHNIGAYAQVLYKPVKKLAITAGMRYDNNSRFGATITPRIGPVLFPNKRTIVKVLYGTAYWAPSPTIAYESYGSFYTTDSGRTYKSAFWKLPNPNLKPETSQTIELSINRKLGKKLNFTLTAYRTTVNHLIKDVPDEGHTNLYNHEFLNWPVLHVAVPVNLGKRYIQGSSLMVHSVFAWLKAQFSAYASVSYIDGKTEEVFAGNIIKKVELPLIAPWQFKASLSGKWNAFYFSTRLQMIGKQRLADYADVSKPDKRQTISGYNLLHLSAGYNIKNRVTIFVNMENALNTRYFSPVDIEPNSASTPSFRAAYQDPLRAMGGVRIML